MKCSRMMTAFTDVVIMTAAKKTTAMTANEITKDNDFLSLASFFIPPNRLTATAR